MRIASGKRFWAAFVWTIIALLVAYLLIIVRACTNTPPNNLEEASDKRAFHAVAQLAGLDPVESFPDTDQLIEDRIDKVFAPAYRNIEAFADMHYTVRGEYTELFYAAAGHLEELIAKHVFEGLDNRLETSLEEIRLGFLDEIKDRLLSEMDCSETSIGEDELETCRSVVAVAVEDMHARFDETSMALKGSLTVGGATTASMVAKAVSAATAKKLLAATATKTAGKGAAKVGASTAGGAAAGAAAGSFIPGVGTIIGGIIVGVVTWLAIDKVFVETDEYVNRDKFENELAVAIDEQKARVKQVIREYLKATIVEVRNQTPRDLSERAVQH